MPPDGLVDPTRARSIRRATCADSVVGPGAVIEAGARIVAHRCVLAGASRGGGPDGGQSGRGNNWRTRLVDGRRPVRDGGCDRRDGGAAARRESESARAVGGDVALPGAVVIAGDGRLGDGRRAAARAGDRATARCRSRASAASGSRTGPGRARWSCASSYSGETAETLACARQAHRQGADLLIVGAGGTLASWRRSGGSPTRRCRAGRTASRGRRWDTCSARWPARSAPAACSSRGDRRRRRAEGVEAVDRDAAARAGRAAGDHDPADLRRRADGGGRLPVEDPAERERQDARLQPRASPSSTHNEIVGWEGAPPGTFAAVLLSRSRPATTQTRRMHRGDGRADRARRGAGRASSRAAATTSAARAFSLVAQGDWVSYDAALERGVDPTPVHRIGTLKRASASSPRHV